MLLPDAPRRRFTADEVYRMVEFGILGEDDPVELIDGELIEMSPQGPIHRSLTVQIRELLLDAVGPGHHAQDHSPIDASPESLPEPDVAVVRGAASDFLHRHPAGADIVVAVEISVTSQRLDRAKAGIYARAGIAEYWNLDVPARRLAVYRQPRPDHGEYTVQLTLHDEDTVEVGGGSLSVSSLLP